MPGGSIPHRFRKPGVCGAAAVLWVRFLLTALSSCCLGGWGAHQERAGSWAHYVMRASR